VPPTTESWTTRRLLAWMTEAFKKKGLESPQLQARILLAHVVGCEELKLYTDPDRPASEPERARLRDVVARALKDEPIQYLVGHWRFFGLDFKVDKRVLIPRPSTETIIEHILQHARVEPGFGGRTGEGTLLADIGTGSGCIAIALLKNLTGARAIATDVSPAALEVARENAQRHAVQDRIEFLEGNLLEPLQDHPAARAAGSLHYLVSNPPYIPDHEWDAVAPNVKDYEPHSALRAGPDGLIFINPLIENGPRFLAPGGLLLIEVAAATTGQILRTAREHPLLEAAQIIDDAEGLPRTLVARRKREPSG
jgi:release factor glutamine methyltransferase